MLAGRRRPVNEIRSGWVVPDAFAAGRGTAVPAGARVATVATPVRSRGRRRRRIASGDERAAALAWHEQAVGLERRVRGGDRDAAHAELGRERAGRRQPGSVGKAAGLDVVAEPSRELAPQRHHRLSIERYVHARNLDPVASMWPYQTCAIVDLAIGPPRSAIVDIMTTTSFTRQLGRSGIDVSALGMGAGRSAARSRSTADRPAGARSTTTSPSAPCTGRSTSASRSTTPPPTTAPATASASSAERSPTVAPTS